MRLSLLNGSAQLLLSHHRLLWRVTRNEMVARYAGSLLGVGWAFLSPLLILAIYAAVYLVIFRVEVPGLTPMGYVLYIFAGLVPYLATAEAVSLGVASVIANKAVLSNTVFPIDLVPAKAVLLAQATMVVGLAIILVGDLLAHNLPWTVGLVPILWALQCMALIGLNWLLSLLNVVFRDLQNLITAILMMLLVASPIAYTPDMVPSSLKVLLIVNPFAYFVTAYQRLLILGQLPDPSHIVILVVGSLGLFGLGSWFFARAKQVIIDYL